MAGNDNPAASRRIFITGANRGLGYELTRLFINRGDTVWGAGRPGRTERLRALQPAGVVEMDLVDETSVAAAVGEVGAELGALDLLINCAGIDARAVGGTEDARGPFDFDATTFTAVSVVNVTGPMVVTREALPLLRQGTDPLVLNVSSQLGSMQVGAEKGRDAAYCVSKAALNMLSVKSAAALRPEGIAVVMLHPGWVSTDMGGGSAPLTPVESATAIVETLAELSLTDSGRFINWDGTDHPW
jgi:NAD(P)-dependent dehydrogenase (short-subunit alcohol dehydrogenase family)